MQAKSTTEILKFCGKAQVKFIKFSLCGKEEFTVVLQAAYLGLRPIKIKTQRQKQLLPGYFCSRLAHTMR